MTNSKAFSLLLGILALSACDCALIGGRGDNRFYPGVYPGVRNHAYYFARPKESDQPSLWWLGIIDLPFSAALDKALLPGTCPTLFETVPSLETTQSDHDACRPALAWRPGACHVAPNDGRGLVIPMLKTGSTGRPFNPAIRRTDTATCFGVYDAPGFASIISHGELEIARLSYSGQLLWSASGRDIFSEGFRCLDSGIEVIDFNRSVYLFDYRTGTLLAG